MFPREEMKCYIHNTLFFFMFFASANFHVSAYRDDNLNDISLWIDENEVKNFAGFPMEIFVIMDGVILPYILDPNTFEKYLPTIPAELHTVNFSWRSGDINEYFYEFDKLKSLHENILQDPIVSINKKGKVPRKAKEFSVSLPCQNRSGIATFEIGLKIETAKGLLLPGFPLRLRLKKACVEHGPDPHCHSKCGNGGHCNAHGICECPKGYIGKYCHTALCYPQCLHGGQCVSPGYCSCQDGYHGPYCEGGMCTERCLNMGQCVNKDQCRCRRGYYGKRCEYSKCKIPCLNRGRCIGLNKCRCRAGYSGTQCEIASATVVKVEDCKKKCVHGICVKKRCSCDSGWFGKKCNRRRPKKRRQRKLH